MPARVRARWRQSTKRPPWGAGVRADQRRSGWSVGAASSAQSSTTWIAADSGLPAPDSAYGAPDDEGGLDSGAVDGDRVESGASDDDEPDPSTEFVDDGEVGGAEAGAGSPESAAIHVVDD